MHLAQSTKTELSESIRDAGDGSLSSVIPRVLIVALPVLSALLVVPGLKESFATPKTAVFVGGAFLCASLAIWRGGKFRVYQRHKGITLAMVAYLFAIILSAAFSPLRYMTSSACLWTLAGMLLFWSGRRLLMGNIHLLLHAIAITSVFVSLIALPQAFVANDLLSAVGLGSGFVGRMRVFSTLGNPNFVGAYICAAIAAPLSLAVQQRKWRRSLWCAVAVLDAAGVLVTGSRAAVLALLVMMGVFALLISGRKRLVVIVIIAALAMPLAVLTTNRTNSRSLNEALSGRVFIWHVALCEGVSLVGTGPGTFAYLYSLEMGKFFQVPGREALLHFAGSERHAQNDFVEILHEQGVLGVLCFASIIWIWSREALRMVVGNAQAGGVATIAASVSGVAAILVCALADFPLHRAETAILFWLWLAVAFVPHVAQRERSYLQDLKFIYIRKCSAVAAAILAVAVSLPPLMCARWIHIGERSEDTGNPATASAAYKKALWWNATSADAHFNLTRSLAMSGGYLQALAQSQTAEEWIDEPELWLLRSRIYRRIGNEEKSRQVLRSAVAKFEFSESLKEEMSQIDRNGSTLK